MESMISPKAKIGSNVSIGYCTKILDNVVIEGGCQIGDFCLLGHPCVKSDGSPLVIGKNSIIRSHGVLYEGSKLGERTETGHHVMIRERTVSGINLRIGSFSELAGDCKMGDYCRFQSYVHVGKGAELGDFVWLFSLVTLTNDPLPPSHIFRGVTMASGSVACVGCTLMPGAHMEKGSFAVSGTHVSGRIPVGAVVAGRDSKIVAHVSNLVHLETNTRHPWMRHFKDAFPEAMQERLASLYEEVIATKFTLKIEGE